MCTPAVHSFATGDELGLLLSPFVPRWQTKVCYQRKSDVEHRGRRHLHEQNVLTFFWQGEGPAKGGGGSRGEM